MSDKHLELELKTCQGTSFTIQYAGYLAEFFFRANASSFGPNAYDEWIKKGADPNRITDDDVSAVNQTMAARTPHKYWTAFTEAKADEPWLTALDPDWDLYSIVDARQRARRVRRLRAMDARDVRLTHVLTFRGR